MIKDFIPKGNLKRRFSVHLASYLVAFIVVIPIFHIINIYLFCLNTTYLQSAAIFFVATTINIIRKPFKTNVLR